MAYLDDGHKQLTGIDNDPFCIQKANLLSVSSKVHFICDDFKTYKLDKLYDAILFVASIHHMEMETALEKAKTLLSSDGLLIIVGLATPTTLLDYVLEALRIVPCKILSKWKSMESSEMRNLPVSYQFPSLKEVRRIKKVLPEASLTYGLYYRYLIIWSQKSSKKKGLFL